MMRWRFAVVAAAMMSLGAVARAEDGTMLVYIGTYNGPRSEGIYVSRMDPQTGALSKPTLASKAQRASFLAIHPNRRLLYAVAEVGDAGGKPVGSVTAYAIDRESGKLTPLNSQPSGGRGPCHVSVDHAGRNALVANYGGGSIAVIPIADDGTLRQPSAVVQHSGTGPNAKRQDKPHAHSINVSPDDRFAFAADLGADKIFIYRFDTEHGTLAPNDPSAATVPPGGGPRHFAFHPGGEFAYVINEMGNSVTAYTYDSAKGALQQIQTIPTLPDGFSGENTTAELLVHPSGKFLYGSNRGHDSIAVFAIDQRTGKLKSLGQTSSGGRTPRNFGIDPTGSYLIAAHQDTDNLVVFRIDPQTGAISPTGSVAEVGSPVCVRFLNLN
jgi:6-phosphogluconolactonase